MVSWSKETMFKYRMPKKKLRRVLKEDRAAVKKVRHGDLVVAQLQELLSSQQSRRMKGLVSNTNMGGGKGAWEPERERR